MISPYLIVTPGSWTNFIVFFFSFDFVPVPVRLPSIVLSLPLTRSVAHCLLVSFLYHPIANYPLNGTLIRSYFSDLTDTRLCIPASLPAAAAAAAAAQLLLEFSSSSSGAILLSSSFPPSVLDSSRAARPLFTRHSRIFFNEENCGEAIPRRR